MTVSILGVNYTIIKKKYDEEEAFARRSIDGFCDPYLKQIVYCDMSTYKGWEHELPGTVVACEKHIIRHELSLIHI